MASFLRSIFKFNNSSSSSNSNNNDFIESNDKLRLRSLKKEEVLIKDIEKTFKTKKFQKYLFIIYIKKAHLVLNQIMS